jgi:polar amino acid transport system permease protein
MDANSASTHGKGIIKPVAILSSIVFLIGLIANLGGLWQVFERITGRASPESAVEDTLSKIQRQKKLTVGFIPYFDISSREAKNNDVRGYLVDVLYRIAADLEIPEDSIEFIETDWENFGLGLNSKKYDLSIAGTFRTPERERVVAFSEPIFYLGNGALVSANDNRFRAIQDFNRDDVTIAVILGEQGYEYAQNHLKLAKLKIMPGTDLSLACLEVERGLADAALSDQYILRLYAAGHPTVKDALENNPYDVLPICWATRKGDDRWMSYLNQQLTQLHDKGWLRRLSAAYPMIPFAKPTGETAVPLSNPKSSLIGTYFWAFGSGIAYTVAISIAAIILGSLLGTMFALLLANSSSSPLQKILRFLTGGIVYALLAIPPLVLIIIFYYNNLLSPLNSATAAIIALGINLSPFVAKIIASSVKSIPMDFIHAAKVFGYSDLQILIRFKMPLVLRNSLWPLLVQWYTTIKLSSLASVIGVTEVLHRSQQVIRETYRTEEVYLILVICYMFIVIPLALLADHYEYKLIGRGARNE